MTDTLRDFRAAAAVGVAFFLLFNANGREIASYDSQPTKFAARELLLRHTLALNHVVGQWPALRERSGFQLARDGRYRASTSPLPAIAAAAVFWPLWVVGLVDVRAPLAPSLISAAASAFFVAVAVAAGFLTARLQLSRSRSVVMALAFGAGTGLWSTASQTLWQHDLAILGLSLAVLALGLMSARHPTRAEGSVALPVAAGIGLALAVGARLQLAPAAVVLLAGIGVISGVRGAVIAATCVAAVMLPLSVANVRWFGTVFGAAPALEAMHERIHGTSGTFSVTSGGFAGLLISPSRGLFVFSPIVLFAAFGVRRMLGAGRRSPIVWCTAAAGVQYVVYGSYVAWWAGHTYGPRYLLDILPLLLPLGIAALSDVKGWLVPSLASAALAWSIFVAGIGAFCHPNGRWNNEPADVDTNHERLWDWRDNQIVRTWRAGPSPQNFSLLTRDAVRVPTP